jgi:hypothetical protein
VPSLRRQILRGLSHSWSLCFPFLAIDLRAGKWPKSGQWNWRAVYWGFLRKIFSLDRRSVLARGKNSTYLCPFLSNVRLNLVRIRCLKLWMPLAMKTRLRESEILGPGSRDVEPLNKPQEHLSGHKHLLRATKCQAPLLASLIYQGTAMILTSRA